MPVFLNWLLRLLPTNPICMRLVQGGSRRMRHLYIRVGYLTLMMVVLMFVLLTKIGGQQMSLRDLAQGLGLISASGATVVKKGKVLEGATGLAVSLEPAGGSPTGAPTGPVLYVGKLQI